MFPPMSFLREVGIGAVAIFSLMFYDVFHDEFLEVKIALVLQLHFKLAMAVQFHFKYVKTWV